MEWWPTNGNVVTIEYQLVDERELESQKDLKLGKPMVVQKDPKGNP